MKCMAPQQKVLIPSWSQDDIFCARLVTATGTYSYYRTLAPSKSSQLRDEIDKS